MAKILDFEIPKTYKALDAQFAPPASAVQTECCRGHLPTFRFAQ